MYDIIIIGAGTAGMSAAIYGVRAGRSVLVLEEGLYGGQIINTPEIVNYPGIKNISGFEFATTLYEQAIELGAKIIFEGAKEILIQDETRIVVTDQSKYEARAVIIATGAKNRKLELPNEDELLGKGVSYCATCDGAFYRGKDVAVAGGGNTALEDAIFLTAYCNKVYIVHRRQEFRGEKKLLENLKKRDNVEFILDSVISSLYAEDVLKSIQTKNQHTGMEQTIEVQGLFVAIGQDPQNFLFSDLIHTDDKGYIIAGEDCRTNVGGIFVAGDNRSKAVRQLATAASDGAAAALGACEYLG
ncbi:MAG: thioredoxin-disulfide reductase [Lachnospiraceae bacterium]